MRAGLDLHTEGHNQEQTDNHREGSAGKQETRQGLQNKTGKTPDHNTPKMICRPHLPVPGEFIRIVTDPWSATQERETLWEKARLFKLVPRSQHGQPQSYVPSSLKSAEYVFVRQDYHRGTFQPPYIRPFHVLESGNKTCKIDMGGRLEYMSVDHLKPAHLDLDLEVG